MKIKRKGMLMSPTFLDYYDYWNMFEPFDYEYNWDGLTMYFDGENMILNGKANSSLINQTDTGLYALIDYMPDTTYTFVISYVSGSVTGIGLGSAFSPKNFTPICIDSTNYKDTQFNTYTADSWGDMEEWGDYNYSYYNNLTFNNLVLKVTVVEGDTSPIINKTKVFGDRIEAINFIEI